MRTDLYEGQGAGGAGPVKFMGNPTPRMPFFLDNDVPYFAWDRQLTVGAIRRSLLFGDSKEKKSMAAWLLREAAFDDVWYFLTPQLVAEMLPSINGQLGRKKDFYGRERGVYPRRRIGLKNR